MQMQSVNQIASRPITWLWSGRFALGKVTEDLGLGKSLLALDLCARPGAKKDAFSQLLFASNEMERGRFSCESGC